MATVRVCTAAHEIEVCDEDADVDDLASLALWLYDATRDPKLDRAFGVSTTHLEAPY